MKPVQRRTYMESMQKAEGGQSQKRGWSEDKPKLEESTIDILENYSKVPRAQIEAHVEDIRQRGWSLFPYPCIGSWRFLELSAGQSPQYSEILRRIKDDEQKYLDLGCCFGQDLRRLAADGAPSHLLHGFDLRSGFFDLGYELFRDRQMLKSTFVAGDIFEMPVVDVPSGYPLELEAAKPTETSHPLLKLQGQISIIHASSFYHLFSWSDQIRAAIRTFRLMKRQPGSMIFGRQSGGWALKPVLHERETPETSSSGEKNNEALTSERRVVGEVTRMGETVYRHDASTWKRFWKEVGENTRTEWDVWVEEKVANEAENRAQLRDVGVEEKVPDGWELRRVWMRFCCRLVAC